MALKRILVTGANKGIGYAVVEKILKETVDTFVVLGSRDAERGQAAVQALLSTEPAWASRLQVLIIDVSKDESVTNAKSALGDEPLYGLVNNAGVWGSPGEIFNTNLQGVQRCADAFLTQLMQTAESDGARLVNVSSGAAPMFVAKCTNERQAFFKDATVTMAQLEAAATQFLSALASAETDGSAALASLGYPPLDGQAAYGASKAFVNLYTLILPMSHNGLRVNSCSPGFIATDLIRNLGWGKTPEEMGALPPAQGTKAIFSLLFGEEKFGPGHYFGSDALRSPLDKYRAPGTPAFEG